MHWRHPRTPGKNSYKHVHIHTRCAYDTQVPGYIEYAGSRIQLLDLPGIIEGAAGGKGRGKQVIAVARSSDLVLMMLDATKGERQRWVYVSIGLVISH